MARIFRSTRTAATLLLLAALPSWTTGAGELFKAASGLASAADTNALAQQLGNVVAENVANSGVLRSAQTGAATGDLAGAAVSAATTQMMGGGVGSQLAGAAAGTVADTMVENAVSSGMTKEMEAATGLPAGSITDPAGAVTNAAASTLASSGLGNNIMGKQQTSLGQGLTWNFGSKSMMDMLTGFFMTFLSGSSDPNSALNIYGSALMSQDPVQISAAFGKLLTSMDLTCAFQMTAGGDGVDLKFRDGREALHLQFVPTATNSVFNFKGQFPTARAFSYATYAVKEKTVEFVDMINDHEIVPESGANPFTMGPSLTPSVGTYDLYITPDGKQGHANEIKSFKGGVADAAVKGLIVVYRVIMTDGIRADGWGAVPPPTLRLRALNILDTGFWVNLQPCDEDKNNKAISQFVDDKLTLQEGVSDVKVECPVFNMENNFVYYDDAQYFKTPDENHIISAANRALLPAGAELITMVSGTLPPQAQSRYSSLSLVNLYPPGKNIYSVSDQALRNFYVDQGKSAVNYTIIMARNRLALTRCGLTKLPSNWYQVYWSGFTDAAVGSYQGVVYREVMTNGYEESLEQVRYACAEAKECSNPKFFEKQMGAHYPRISYLICSADGQIRPAPFNPNVTFAEPVLPTPAPQGIWTDLAARDELGIKCEPHVNVDMTALQGSDVYIDGKLAGRATDNPKVVSKQAASFGWSPIQAVFYDEANPATANPVIKSYIGADGAEVKMELVPTPANFLPEKVTLAVRVPVTGGAKAFFAAADVCGLKQASAAGWKCKAGDFKDANWTLPQFDDSDWLPAKATKRPEACQAMGTDCNLLPPDAQGIWVDTCTGGAGPAEGYVYCRKTLPQKCDLTCLAGSADRASVWCPDKANAMATARFASPTLHWLFVNGEEVGGDQTMVNPVGSTSFYLDRTQRTLVLAFKAVDDTRKVVKSFIKGAFNLCGYEYVTEDSWKCAPSEPFGDAWTLPGFDDAAWRPIRIVDGFPWQPANPAGMSPAASWVWAPNDATEAWCRLEVPNPIFDPTVAEVEIQ